VVSYGFVTAAKNLSGRVRPELAGEDPFDFGFGRGLRGSDYRSFPSGHTAGAFAVAAAVTAETREHRPEWTPYVAAVLYTGAAGVGLTRVYHDRHWASDAMAGAALGTFSGLKVVRYHHGNPDNVVDRWLLPRAVVPTERGPMLVWALPMP
jgi:membrane-associated phospholipid phosphatase